MLTRRVTRYEPDGSVTVIANSFGGKRLLRPNDVIVKSDGAIYFTDPGGNAAPDQWDVTVSGVYRVSPDLGTMSARSRRHGRPNGLAFSPNENVLYVADTRRRHLRAYDVLANGTVAKETSRVFVDLAGTEPGAPDGIKVDSQGNVYSGGSGGLFIVDPMGKKLGRIVHGQPATTNIAFGGDDWRTLYFTTRSTLFSVGLKVQGFPFRQRGLRVGKLMWALAAVVATGSPLSVCSLSQVQAKTDSRFLPSITTSRTMSTVPVDRRADDADLRARAREAGDGAARRAARRSRRAVRARRRHAGRGRVRRAVRRLQLDGVSRETPASTCSRWT